MTRYSLISEKIPREFLLLQGRGCAWKRCTFCDYHTDVSDNPFLVNSEVLSNVTGQYGVLDIINSGSCVELDDETISLIKKIAYEKQIHTIWFEAHWIYRNKLTVFAEQFKNVNVKFRTGIETFDPQIRSRWDKGIPDAVTVNEIGKYFQGVCLLIGVAGQTAETISHDIELAMEHFEYFSVNAFVENSTKEKRDNVLVDWFVRKWGERINSNPKAELLIDNCDLGVG